MTRLPLIALAVLSLACAERPFTAETPAPSETRIRELARVDRPVVIPARSELAIVVYPRVIFAGSGARITCLLPADPEARWLTYGIALLRISVAQLGDLRAALVYETVIDGIPCGTWVAVCQLASASRPIIRRTYTLDVKGRCNSIGDPK